PRAVTQPQISSASIEAGGREDATDDRLALLPLASQIGIYGTSGRAPGQSAFIPPNFTTLAPFSVFTAMSLSNSPRVRASTVAPSPVSRSLILGSARPALISRLSLSTISAGVFLGAPKPRNPLAS